MNDFSVLLPVYAGDNADHFALAITSATSDQTLKPDQLVIVCDGPIGGSLDTVLASVNNLTQGVPVTVERLPHNVGLARALQAGLARCAHDIVARADADDISEPQRFALQVTRLAEDHLDLLGSAIQEFDTSGRLGPIRRLPETERDIVAMAPFRDPFNHPTVVYRKSVVQAAGGYTHLNKMEDYWLFVRMLHAGARVANIPEPLVRYRVDEGAYQRRGGLQMLRSDWDLQRRMRTLGFIDTPTFIRNVAVRCGYRLVPTPLRRRAYRAAFTRPGD
ncbi:MAG: glycosyltransferase [Propioniciclava sp.]